MMGEMARGVGTPPARWKAGANAEGWAARRGNKRSISRTLLRSTLRKRHKHHERAGVAAPQKITVVWGIIPSGPSGLQPPPSPCIEFLGLSRSRRNQDEFQDEAKPLNDQSKSWPADKVERRAVESLVPYARNARTHSPAQIDQIAASIREWGWTVPVLLDEWDGIIAGHGRVLAAKKLGLGEIPCMVARGWSDAQRKAYVLADNKLALNAGWDEELLKIELGDLRELDFNIDLTGFGLEEVELLLADKSAGLTDPDDAPEPPAVPVSELGDVWLLGSHRLVCGDSTTVESVDKALNGVKPHLMVTDPLREQ